MICLAASGPLLASWQPRSVAVGIDREHTLHERIGTTGLHFGVVRPAQLHHHDGLVGVSGFPLLRHLGAHRERNTSLVTAGNRDAAVAQRAEERGQDDALAKCFLHSRLHRFVIPDVQGRSIHTLGHDLVNVLGHDGAIGLAVEDEHFSAVLFLGILLASVACA